MDSWLNRLERCPTKSINFSFSLLFISLVGGLGNQHRHQQQQQHQHLLSPSPCSGLPSPCSALAFPSVPRSINVLLFYTSWIYYFLLIFDFSDFPCLIFFFWHFVRFFFPHFFFFFLFRGAVGVVRTSREAAQWRPRRMILIVVAKNRTWQSSLSTRLLLHVPPLFSLHFPFRILHNAHTHTCERILP